MVDVVLIGLLSGLKHRHALFEMLERQLFVFDLLLLCEWYQLSEGELLLEDGWVIIRWFISGFAVIK